jgi:hypothetical protein
MDTCIICQETRIIKPTFCGCKAKYCFSCFSMLNSKECSMCRRVFKDSFSIFELIFIIIFTALLLKYIPSDTLTLLTAIFSFRDIYIFIIVIYIIPELMPFALLYTIYKIYFIVKKDILH